MEGGPSVHVADVPELEATDTFTEHGSASPGDQLRPAPPLPPPPHQPPPYFRESDRQADDRLSTSPLVTQEQPKVLANSVGHAMVTGGYMVPLCTLCGPRRRRSAPLPWTRHPDSPPNVPRPSSRFLQKHQQGHTAGQGTEVDGAASATWRQVTNDGPLRLSQACL